MDVTGTLPLTMILSTVHDYFSKKRVVGLIHLYDPPLAKGKRTSCKRVYYQINLSFVGQTS